jgi:imidazolonepropionase-like amidohydrolase
LNYGQINEIIQTSTKNKKITVAHTQVLEETMKLAEMDINGFAHLWFRKESITNAQLKLLNDKQVFLIPTALTQKKIWEMIHAGPAIMKKAADANESSMELVQQEILKLHNAGVLILAGNDPPNFGINQHDDLFEELQIYRRAGLSNIDVLKTATSNPSKVFDLDGVGIVVERERANFILLTANPIEDLAALKQIEGIWKNGRRIR